MVGTVAITDFGWYENLGRLPYREEVNFWTPSARRTFRAPEFSPFFFKLKAPHNAIAGFGYFAQYSSLPDWLAWQCFGEANGCATFDEMQRRIGDIRRRFGYVSEDRITEIGCIVVVNATFFGREAWVPQPRDWPVRTLTPTRYDLTQGEGARIWAACLERAHPAGPVKAATEPSLVEIEGPPRRGAPMVVHPRLGQGAFRVAVTQAYNRACAVTQEHSLPALEAAHIQPFAKDGPHVVRNGLLLRADLHRLFEQGYLTVTPNFQLEVSGRLRQDYQNGHSYYPLHGKQIALPPAAREQPAPELLRWHNEYVYLG